MKRHLLIIMFALASGVWTLGIADDAVNDQSNEQTGGQASQGVPQATKWYGVIKTEYADVTHLAPSFQSVTYYLQGEINFNDTVYQALYRNDGEYCAGIRYEDNGKKVFIRPTDALAYHPWPVGVERKTEYPLYNFDVEVGDVIEAYDCSGAHNFDYACEPDDPGCIDPTTTQYQWTVQDIQVIDGRKHVWVRGGQSNHLVEWIEGIGTRYILFESSFFGLTALSGKSTWALCAADSEGNILYSFDTNEIGVHNENCKWTITALEEVPAEELLNISGNVLTLKGTDANAVSAIFSADGRQVMSFTGNTADISTLPQGLYVLRTAASNGKNQTAKFVK